MRELRRDGLPGIPFLVGLPLLVLVTVVWFMWALLGVTEWETLDSATATAHMIASLVAGSVFGVGLRGLFMVNPNEAQVLQLFGDYRGTAHTPGLRWTNPFYTRRAISLRVRNFETPRLKVNDKRGNPVEIATIVVWRVIDTAEAAFVVDNYDQYVHVQSEAALRNLATGYVYDAYDPNEVALSSHVQEISQQLKSEIQDRLYRAGVEVHEARISHLAYAPEIAATMLRRQQASAIVAARQRFVDGAVGMVEHALSLLTERGVVDLDQERRAAMVSNLLVVLCSDHATQPVVNAGTLYP
jgi:hypothetical protein